MVNRGEGCQMTEEPTTHEQSNEHVRWIAIITTILLIAATSALAHLVSENARLEKSIIDSSNRTEEYIDLRIKLSECTQTLLWYQREYKEKFPNENPDDIFLGSGIFVKPYFSSWRQLSTDSN